MPTGCFKKYGQSKTSITKKLCGKQASNFTCSCKRGGNFVLRLNIPYFVQQQREKPEIAEIF